MNKYCVAVSGGCDSMTLLDQCIRKKMNIIVAHVNYQKRESAKRDENLVREYCERYQIPFFVRYCDPHYKGNFQAYARRFRYEFFKELCEQENCDSVLVAHQQDDLFETYLMQCRRKSIPLVYGLAAKVKHHGVVIERPLLNMSKKDCYNYCYDHEVPFGEDESNFSNDYLRNRLRREVVDTWDETKRQEVLTEINRRNAEMQQYQKEIERIAKELGEDLPIEKFKKLKHPQDVLRAWLNHQGVGYSLSERRIRSICETILKDESRYEFDIDDCKLMKSYDVLQLVRDIEYAYTFDKIEEFDCEYFKIRKNGSSVEAVTLSAEDFPITIRSPKEGDQIELRFGKKKLNRFFIDRKISHKERKSYPVVVNSVGNVVLVPKIGCDVKHYTVKPNCFVIK
ncbi:tRNA lysidine(34) synthetase TilS [uncultured Traorella sp.]|uniref:tRNA lysidine(34) synthetase TilS n=1 Tax=uncultured Traorella sp. TaxID=1929048 RepID=UPI0025EA2050|nr:tRNA lysidine(34) synthetase TilS [uncultured Traorella sp.]